ncbi:hypothetical protein [Achromobacter kerstersii]|uniref:hypothetical protein n=1 Tax=Achromobacter kerstersii TaxID=1353890 RepID=UPI0006C40439|nr:hypothetical protein [Achromobacter kerstersii]CUI27281.1 Uncharacterised protein [Achromobacter kerstersii]
MANTNSVLITTTETDPRQQLLPVVEAADINAGITLGSNGQPVNAGNPAPAANGPLSLDHYSLGNGLTQDFGALAGIERIVTNVPARKPNSHAFIRVHPSADYRLQVFILNTKDDGENYLVSPKLYAELAQEVRPKMLYTGVTREGNPFLWPVNMPGEDGRLDDWSQSAHQAAGIAQTHWVRLVANRSMGAYDVMKAANLSVEPKWPDKTFTELLNLAFRDKVINDLNHVILRRLRGEL